MPRRDPNDRRVTPATEKKQKVAAARVAGTMASGAAKTPDDSERGRNGAPVRRSFLLTKDGQLSPLSSLIRSKTGSSGGRNGARTRLAVLLTLLWVCAKPTYGEDGAATYRTHRTSSQLAELIGFEHAGRSSSALKASSEAVDRALRDLEGRGYLQISSGGAGQKRVIVLLREDLTGAAYSVPPGGADSYIRVSEHLWRSGSLSELNAPGIAMLLVALELTKFPQQALILTESFVKERYGLSNSTRRRGLEELVSLGVLDCTQRKERAGGEGGAVRSMNIYTLHESYLPRPRPMRVR